MRITELSLDTQNLQAQLDFYTNILGLPLKERTSDTFTVQAGTTRLTLRATTQATLYHFAFTIPSNKFAAAKAWLTARVPLLSLDGQDEFVGESWNSGSLYFRDPANHILEFIVHYDLHSERSGPFGAADLLYISEIGMAFDNVSEAVKAERAAFRIEPYRESIGDVFAAVGDISGLFITVKIGRNWFPTDDSPALVSPVDVTIEGVEGRSQQLAPFPYHVTVK